MTNRPKQDLLRTVVLSPYRNGMGPRWRLRMRHAAYDAKSGRAQVAYELTMVGERKPLFSGADYSPSPMHALDSDESVAGLLGFLTLRPGDTDDEYFADYTMAQRAFCAEHAEALSCEAINRFGES